MNGGRTQKLTNPRKVIDMYDSIDEEALTDQEREFLEYARQMPDADQEAMLRAMQYIAANPNHGYKSEAKVAELVEQMKRRH
jgi:hypothetical protein